MITILPAQPIARIVAKNKGESTKRLSQSTNQIKNQKVGDGTCSPLMGKEPEDGCERTK